MATIEQKIAFQLAKAEHIIDSLMTPTQRRATAEAERAEQLIERRMDRFLPPTIPQPSASDRQLAALRGERVR